MNYNWYFSFFALGRGPRLPGAPLVPGRAGRWLLLRRPLRAEHLHCNAGDLGSIPGLGRSPGEGNSYSLQYSGLENSMDCIVHGVAKSQTQLSNFHTEVYLTLGL